MKEKITLPNKFPTTASSPFFTTYFLVFSKLAKEEASDKVSSLNHEADIMESVTIEH